VDRHRKPRSAAPTSAAANSLAFSPDGGRLYFTDSWAREIWCCDYYEDGRIGAPRTFARIPPSQGFPDGSTDGTHQSQRGRPRRAANGWRHLCRCVDSVGGPERRFATDLRA